MTTTHQKLNWSDSGFDAIFELAHENPRKRFIGVAVEMVCSVAEIPAGMSVHHALADYAIGYQTDEPCTISVRWVLYENGEESDGDGWKFLVK